MCVTGTLTSIDMTQIVDAADTEDALRTFRDVLHASYDGPDRPECQTDQRKDEKMFNRDTNRL